MLRWAPKQIHYKDEIHPKCLQRSLPIDYYYHATISNEKVGSGSIQPTLSYFFTIKQHRGKSHGHYFHQTLTYTTLTNVQVLATVEPTQPKSRARSFLRTRVDPPWWISLPDPISSVMSLALQNTVKMTAPANLWELPLHPSRTQRHLKGWGE